MAPTKKPMQGIGFYSLLWRLHVKTEVHHVAIFDDVFLAFQTPFTRFLGTGLTFELDEVVVRDHLGTNKAFFEVGVDHTGGLRGGSTYFYSPGTNF